MPCDNVAANGRSAAANFQTNADLFMNIRMRCPAVPWCPITGNRNRIIFIYFRNCLCNDRRSYTLTHFLEREIVWNVARKGISLLLLLLTFDFLFFNLTTLMFSSIVKSEEKVVQLTSFFVIFYYSEYFEIKLSFSLFLYNTFNQYANLSTSNKVNT